MIETHVAGGRWTLTLARPDKANALTAEMLQALELAVGRAENEGAPVLVLTGQGRVFSAGADLDEARGGTLTTNPVWEHLSTRIARFPGLTICALNGTCAGGAIGMMLACDLRVAVEGAKVFYPVVKNGFLPQPSDPRRMAALVGLSRTKTVLLAGQKIDSATALNWGLFDRVVPDAEGLEPEIAALSADALEARPGLIAGIKALCHGEGDRRAMPGPAPQPARLPATSHTEQSLAQTETPPRTVMVPVGS